VSAAAHFPDVPEALMPFVSAGVLRPGQARTAALMASLGGEHRPEVVLAVALAGRAPEYGSVCVDLARIVEQIVPTLVAAPEAAAAGTEEESDVSTGSDDGAGSGRSAGVDGRAGTVEGAVAGSGSVDLAPVDLLEWPEPSTWADLVAGSPLAGSPGAGAGSSAQVPLVVVEGSLLYLYRHWVLECFVAADLTERAAIDRRATFGPDDEGVEEMFRAAAARHGADPDPLQVAAARAASRSALAVISGGPGTGKTTTVSTMLAAWIRSGGAGATGERIRLAAPTGKAAARMSEAIRRSADALGDDLSPDERQVLESLEATTIHRLLGRGRGGGFRHGSDNPIAADLVVIDEVSMVSLGLMAHLLAAVPPTASLVLVGDPDQLASVEAGSVLGDLLGRDPVEGAAPGPPDRLAQSAVELQTMHRVEGESQIAELAQSIRTGDPDLVIERLRSGLVGIEWIDPGDPNGPHRQAELDLDLQTHAESLVDAARDLVRQDDRSRESVGRLLDRLAAVKVLCALRRGPSGADEWNRRIEEHLVRRRGAQSTWYSGRPVMVLRNDYLNRVFNGDIGIAVRERDGEFHDVWFAREPDPLSVPSARLGDYTTQWAMSIHKSQGSEFDHVVVTLPPPPSRILTRELLYTAVTRARQKVTIIATEAAIRVAVDRPAARASGLTQRLTRVDERLTADS